MINRFFTYPYVILTTIIVVVNLALLSLFLSIKSTNNSGYAEYNANNDLELYRRLSTSGKYRREKRF